MSSTTWDYISQVKVRINLNQLMQLYMAYVIDNIDPSWTGEKLC